MSDPRAAFAVGMDERYFEDYLPGAAYQFGDVEVAEDEMLDFARRRTSLSWVPPRRARERGGQTARAGCSPR